MDRDGTRCSACSSGVFLLFGVGGWGGCETVGPPVIRLAASEGFPGVSQGSPASPVGQNLTRVHSAERESVPFLAQNIVQVYIFTFFPSRPHHV